MRPNSKGMPDFSEYPIAALTPESGTGTTMSASAGCSTASSAPILFRTRLTGWPNKRESGRGKGMIRPHPPAVRDQELPRLDVADELRPDQVEGAGLRSEADRPVQPAHRQRAEAPGIAGGDQLVAGDESDGERPFHLLERVHKS